MVDGDSHTLLRLCGFPGETKRAVAAVELSWQQDAAGVAAGPARIVRRVVVHRLVLPVDHGGGDVGGDGAVRRELQGDAQAAARLKAHGTALYGGDGGAGTALPHHAAFVGSRREIDGPAVIQHHGFGEAERFAVDGHREVVRIGDVEDPLAGAGETEGIFGVLDVPDLVEAVDEAARKLRVRRCPMGAPDAQMSVAKGKERFQCAGIAGGMAGLHELPGIVGEADAVSSDECHEWRSFGGWRCGQGWGPGGFCCAAGLGQPG